MHAGNYTPALDINIHIMAGTLLCYDLAMDEICTLDKATITETTARGSYSHAHPAFDVRTKAEDQLRKQMKELGLTAMGTRARVEEDPLLEVVAAVKDVKQKSTRRR